MSNSSGRFVYAHPIERFQFMGRASMQIERATLCTNRSAKARLSRLPGWKNVVGTYREEFVNADAYLLTDECGYSNQITIRAERYARDILNMLACARMYYSGRKVNAQFGLKGHVGPAISEHALVSTLETGTSHSGWSGRGSWMPTQLHEDWWLFVRQRKINQLFGIRSSTRFTEHWKSTLWRAGLLIGRSQQTTSRSEAFLLMMMALDVLLLRRFDRSSDLERRVFGLIGFEALQIPFAKVSELYKLRCDIVHDGKVGTIGPLDLHYLDFFALNVFENIWRVRAWSTKNALIDFTEHRAIRRKWLKNPKLRVESVAYHPSYERLEP